MTYAEKLQDPRWQKLRLEILNRDNWSCRYCGDTSVTLHVHHRHYFGNNPWDTPPECLDTLCKDCHAIIHKMTPLEFYLYEAVVNRENEDGRNIERIKMLNRVVEHIRTTKLVI